MRCCLGFRSRSDPRRGLHVIEYVAAAHTGGQVVLWVLAVWSTGYVVLTAMTLLEIRKFSRWSDEFSRERCRHHAAAMRRLTQQPAESERLT